jgi:Tfp pilus assembly protein PilZ
MDPRAHERRHHFRGKAHAGRVMRVRFRTGADWIEAETRDIGVGGAFIAVAVQPAIGTTLTIELALPTSDQVFTLPAVIRWCRPNDVAEIGGIGVQFVGVDVDVLLELNDYFATLT